jgi:hypothetical protein
MEPRMPDVSRAARLSDEHQGAASCEPLDEDGMAWALNVINDDTSAAQNWEE